MPRRITTRHLANASRRGGDNDDVSAVGSRQALRPGVAWHWMQRRTLGTLLVLPALYVRFGRKSPLASEVEGAIPSDLAASRHLGQAAE